MIVNYISRNIYFQFCDNLYSTIAGSGNASTAYFNFIIIKALIERILHNNAIIYNIMLSILHSWSGYAILVQLGVKILTVYRMKLFYVSFNARVRYFNVSIYFCKTEYSYIILKSLHYTGNVRI